jgi:hypothetical protein
MFEIWTAPDRCAAGRFAHAGASLAKALKSRAERLQNRIERLMPRRVIQGFTGQDPAGHRGQPGPAVMSIAIEGERSGAVVRRAEGLSRRSPPSTPPTAAGT